MPRPRAFSRSHPKFCSTVFLEGALSRGPLFRGPRGPTQAPSPAPPAPLLSVALGPGAPENTELGMELESASWLSPLSLRVPMGEGPGHSGQQTEASFLHGQCVCVWGGVHQALPGKGPLPFPDLPADRTRTAVRASLVAVPGCRGELSLRGSPEDRTLLVQHPLRPAQSGPLRAGGLATRSPADGASVR